MILYAVYRVGHFITLSLPRSFTYWLGSRIADIVFILNYKTRRLIIANLTHALGDDSDKIRACAREILRNFAKYLVEFLRFEKMGKEYIEKNVKIEGVENVRGALKSGKGVIAFSAHLGNWEWGAALLAQLGFPISVIALAHKNKHINDFFISQRAIKGVKNIPLGGSVRKTMELLKKNELIGILSDRDFSDNSVRINFFGKPAVMPVGIGLFAVKCKCPILPVFIMRQKDNTYKYVLEKPLEYTLTGNKDADIRTVVQKATNAIEKYIKLYPEQWYMFDDPWKNVSGR